MTHASPETPAEPYRGRVKDHSDTERLPALRPGFCDYCNQPLSKASKARHARFCSPKCRQRWWVVARNRGAQLYQLLVIWRRYSGRKGTRGAGMLGRISRLIDTWRHLDKEGSDT